MLFLDIESSKCEEGSDPNGIRTRVTAVKGRCPRPLDDRVGERQISGCGQTLQAAFHVLRRPKGDLKGEATIIQCGWTLVFDTASPARTRGAEAAPMFRLGRA